MVRSLLAVALLGGCISVPAAPSPAGLQPQITVDVFGSRLRVFIGVQTRTAIDVSATYRGQTVTGATSTENSGTAQASATILWFDLGHPLVDDEPVVIDVDGVEETITTPPAFDNVQAPATISRSQPATITWTTASADAGRYMTQEGCAGGYGGIAANATSLTLGPASWNTKPDAGTCTIVLRLYRDHVGTLDPAFAGSDNVEQGYMQFERFYDVTFTSTP